MNLLWTGTVVGAVVGAFNAAYVYQTVRDTAPEAATNQTRAIYYAVWTFTLWVLFGSYLLFLWVIAAVLYFGFKSRAA